MNDLSESKLKWNALRIRVTRNLFLLFVTTSCSSVRLEDKTNCTFNKQEIINILKERKKHIKDFAIVNPMINSEHNCVGLFFLQVYKWKGVKTNLNLVSVPVLRTKEKVFVNLSVINNRFSGDEIEKSLDKELRLFENEVGEYFTEEDLTRIRRKYKYGVEIVPSGYLFM